MDSHWQRVHVLHGDGQVWIVVVLQLPEVLLLVMGENPACGAPVLPLVCSSFFQNLVTQQQVVGVNFGLLTKSLQTQSQFLLEFTHQPKGHVIPFTLLIVAEERMNTIILTPAKFSTKVGQGFGVVSTTACETHWGLGDPIRPMYTVSWWYLEKRDPYGISVRVLDASSSWNPPFPFVHSPPPETQASLVTELQKAI